VYAGSWMESAGPSQVKFEVLGWFKDWAGYPAEAAGSLTRGGSAANMTALACAWEAKAGAMRDDLVLYVSDQAHSSVARAARILGFRPDQVRVLPTDGDLRLAPESLATAIQADLRAGRTPLAARALAWGVSFAIIGADPRVATAFALLAVVGTGRIVVDVAGRTLLQRVAPVDLLCRVFGLLGGRAWPRLPWARSSRLCSSLSRAGEPL
jgi:Pyridoxal-dependent decarboxylase conserved domain